MPEQINKSPPTKLEIGNKTPNNMIIDAIRIMRLLDFFTVSMVFSLMSVILCGHKFSKLNTFSFFNNIINLIR